MTIFNGFCGFCHDPNVAGQFTLAPTTDVQHFFAQYLLILEKMRFGSFKFNFPDFQQLRIKRYAKYIFCFAFVIVTQQFSIFSNFDKSIYERM
jgi:hypothetical protein